MMRRTNRVKVFGWVGVALLALALLPAQAMAQDVVVIDSVGLVSGDGPPIGPAEGGTEIVLTGTFGLDTTGGLQFPGLINTVEAAALIYTVTFGGVAADFVGLPVSFNSSFNTAINEINLSSAVAAAGDMYVVAPPRAGLKGTLVVDIVVTLLDENGDPALDGDGNIISDTAPDAFTYLAPDGEGEGEGGVTPPEGEGEGGVTPPEGEGEGGVTPPEGEGEGGVTPPEGEGEGGVTPPEGEGEGVAPPELCSPDLVSIIAPLEGSRIVVPAASDTTSPTVDVAVFINVSCSLGEDAEGMEVVFTLDGDEGDAQPISAGDSSFSITVDAPFDGEAHTLFATVTQEGIMIDSQIVNFTAQALDESVVDPDTGLPRNPFETLLPGDVFNNTIEVGGETVTIVVILLGADTLEHSILVRDDTGAVIATVTITIPAGLIPEGENAVVIFELAATLEALFASSDVTDANSGLAAIGTLNAGIQFLEFSIILEDGTELVLGDGEFITIVIEPLVDPGTDFGSGLFSHETDANLGTGTKGATGLNVSIGVGDWTEVVATLSDDGTSISADLTSLSVFAVVDTAVQDDEGEGEGPKGGCAAAPGVPLGQPFSNVAGDLMALALAAMVLLSVRSRKRPALVRARRTM